MNENFARCALILALWTAALPGYSQTTMPKPATQAEANAGTSTKSFISPKTLAGIKTTAIQSTAGFNTAFSNFPALLVLGVGTYTMTPPLGLTNVTIRGQGPNATTLNAISNTAAECFFISSNVTIEDLSYTNSNWKSPQGLFQIRKHADNVNFRRMKFFGSATDIEHDAGEDFTRVRFTDCDFITTSVVLDGGGGAFKTNIYDNCTFTGIGTHPDTTWTNTAQLFLMSSSNVVIVNGGRIDLSSDALNYTNTLTPANGVCIAVASDNCYLELNNVTMIGTNKGFDLFYNVLRDGGRIVSRNCLAYARCINEFSTASRGDVEIWNNPRETLTTGQAYAITNQFIVPAGWQYFNSDVSNVITWSGSNWAPGISMVSVNTNHLLTYGTPQMDLNGSWHWNPSSTPQQYTNDDVLMKSALHPSGTSLVASNTLGSDAIYTSIAGRFTNSWTVNPGLGTIFAWFEGTYAITVPPTASTYVIQFAFSDSQTIGSTLVAGGTNWVPPYGNQPIAGLTNAWGWTNAWLLAHCAGQITNIEWRLWGNGGASSEPTTNCVVINNVAKASGAWTNVWSTLATGAAFPTNLPCAIPFVPNDKIAVGQILPATATAPGGVRRLAILWAVCTNLTQ